MKVIHYVLLALIVTGGCIGGCTCSNAGIKSVSERESWNIPELTAPVHVLRTQMNIPHIYAENELDLYRTQGFLMAQDRYIQFEFGRRFGQGRVAELLGEIGLSIDQQARGRGMHVVAQRLWTNATQRQKEILEAFVQGINAYVREVKKGNLPVPSELEFFAPLLGVEDATTLLKQVEAQDVMGMAAVIVSQLGYESTDVDRDAAEANIAGHFVGAPFEEARQAGLMTDLWLPLGPLKPNSSALGWGFETPGGLDHPLNRDTKRRRQQISTEVVEKKALPQSLYTRLSARNKGFDQMLGHGQKPMFGSNAWAISGQHTRNGGSILSGDGHLPLSVPSLFYQMCLDTKQLGDGDITRCGLFFPGLPFMSVGTNGNIAWSQTYLNGDITDWYREEIQLDSAGRPSKSRFNGEWKDLVSIEESYLVVDPESGTTSTIRETRWTTFDGRWLTGIEGYEAGEISLQEGQSPINLLGDRIIPQDTNGDAIIEGVSFDWTAFDITKTLEAVDKFSECNTVDEFREQTKKLVAYAQNIIVADKNGEILYTPYNATPCRSYLPRDEHGAWLPGANPMRLLDGTRYGGFVIPLQEDGTVEHDDENPYRCAIPFDDIPQARSPARGYVYTANNDIGGVSLDRSLSNDAWYFAGPFALGYRAYHIETALQALVSEGEVTKDHVRAIQNIRTSALGNDLGPILLRSLQQIKGLVGVNNKKASEARSLLLYQEHETIIDTIIERLEVWLDAGAPALSGVETFYHTVAPNEGAHAVATTIFNTWIRMLFRAVFEDEALEFLWEPDGDRTRVRALHAVLHGAGPNNPGDLASWSEQLEASAYMDNKNTEIVEGHHETVLQALINSIEYLRGAPNGAGLGGFGTENMNEWLWGLRHQVRFDSLLSQLGGENVVLGLLGMEFSITTQILPLAENIPAEDPRASLLHFPRPGDFFSVDAAHAGLASDHYFYGAGPVMRMNIELTPNQVTITNILPGGQSGAPENVHSLDQLKSWLGNEDLPVHFYANDVVKAANARDVFRP